MHDTIDRKFTSLYFLIAGLIALLALVDIGTIYAFLKPIPIWMLLGVAARAPLAKTKRGRALVLGLALSSIGDITLGLPIELALLLGIAAFFFAQAAYAASFFALFEYRPKRLPIALLVGAWAALMVYILGDHLGDMALPVYLYLGVVATMMLAALFRSPVALTVFYGAAVFGASDSLIALNRFVEPIPLSGFWIMSTYYIAQYLIVRGSLEDHAGE
ncbi:MAG: lysoplasmalogenase [bacterium]|nr:lysoplasmalogenase [bacterium]